MTVRARLLVIVVFVALVPLTISAVMGLRVHQRAYEHKLGELQQKTAELGAARVEGWLTGGLRGVRLLVGETIRWSELDTTERASALWLVYRQVEDIGAAALLDEAGAVMVPPAYQDADHLLDELRAHPALGAAELDLFTQAVPLRELAASPREQALVLGQPFLAGQPSGSYVPVALRVPGTRWVIGVALSLERMCQSSLAGAHDERLLLDPAGRLLCGAGSPRLRPASAGLRKVLASARPMNYHSSSGLVIAAASRLASGWTVVAQQPVAVALAPSRRLLWQTLFWIAVSLVIALAAGWYLARSIDRPVHALALAAGEIGRGNFGHRLPPGGRDELGRLSDALNQMGRAIAERDAEIRGWNTDLQRRVGERTQELREAQQQILESHKLGAMAALGAGFAHEINNPLTGVLGLTQLLLARARSDGRGRDVELLSTAEAEGQRIRDIVQRVLALAESSNQERLVKLTLEQVAESALQLVAERASTEGITLERSFAADVPAVQGDPTRLQQALVQVLDNALTACKGGGTINIETRSVEGQLARLTVRDSGPGIPPELVDRVFEPFFTTKANWQSKGLGLSVVFRVVEAHSGRVKVESQVGQGTSVHIVLPAVRQGAHLE